MEQVQVATAALAVVVAVSAAAPATTFLTVARDVAPPPLVASVTAKTNSTTASINFAQCSQMCFAATAERCRAFVWRPLTPPPVLATISTNNNNNINSSSGSSGRDISSEGRCELLPCLPHPASFISYPGAQLFVIKAADTPSPPPAFTLNLVPSSYSMACTFAFKVFTVPQLGHWQAVQRCAQDGARLIVLKSPEDEEALGVAVKPSEPYWIGLTDHRREGDWRWADQSELNYSNWDNGQPNNYLRGDEDQDCVMLYKGHWNDHQCQDPLRFICQVPLLYR